MRVAAVAALAGMMAGCDPAAGGGHEPDQIKVLSPDPQYGAAGAAAARRVSVEVLTAPVAGLLGGEGVRHPVAGERLLLRPADPQSGLRPSVAEGVTTRVEPRFDVVLGPAFGDQYLEVRAPAARR